MLSFKKISFITLNSPPKNCVYFQFFQNTLNFPAPPQNKAMPAEPGMALVAQEL